MVLAYIRAICNMVEFLVLNFIYKKQHSSKMETDERDVYMWVGTLRIIFFSETIQRALTKCYIVSDRFIQTFLLFL